MGFKNSITPWFKFETWTRKDGGPATGDGGGWPHMHRKTASAA